MPGIKNMNRSHLQLIISLVFLLLDSMPANALTLGRLQVNSAMGEPLKAEIEVTRFSAEELQGLTARIASPSSYRNDGLSYNPTLSGVTPQIEMRGNNRPFIVLTGTSPVNETFLDVILQTKWSTGDLIKRYSVLLNTSNDNPVRQTSAESTK
jgi:pilus assembly protein FimV